MNEPTVAALGANVATSEPATGTPRRAEMARALWEGLLSAWLLLLLAGVLALLTLLALLLPQLPGQLHNEAGATDRWLTTAASGYGAAGLLLRNLGFFDIIHSPLFLGVLVLAAFLLLMHMAQLVLAAYRFQQVSAVLDAVGTVNGEPLPVRAGTLVLRWRQAYRAAPLSVTRDLQRLLEARLRRVDRRTVRVAPAPAATMGEADSAQDAAASTGTGTMFAGVTLEERLLAIRGLRAILLQPLLALGMLAALALVWLNVAFGWTFSPPSLVPGESTSDTVHRVRFEYLVTEPGPNLIGPVLRATVGDETAVLPLADELRTEVAGVELLAQPGLPALLVRTPQGAPLLARPGQVTPVDSIGLGFPRVGSEETLLLPQQGIGLRIVRTEAGLAGPAEDAFLVEVYRSDSDSIVARHSVTGSSILTLPAGDSEVALAFVPLPSLAIQVRRMPALWLLVPALVLIVAGAFGFWPRPGFVLAQIGPWPVERSVITVQSDLHSEMTSLRSWYSEQRQALDQETG